MGLRNGLQLRSPTVILLPGIIEYYTQRGPHNALKGTSPASRVTN